MWWCLCQYKVSPPPRKSCSWCYPYPCGNKYEFDNGRILITLWKKLPKKKKKAWGGLWWEKWSSLAFAFGKYKEEKKNWINNGRVGKTRSFSLFSFFFFPQLFICLSINFIFIRNKFKWRKHSLTSQGQSCDRRNESNRVRLGGASRLLWWTQEWVATLPSCGGRGRRQTREGCAESLGRDSRQSKGMERVFVVPLLTSPFFPLSLPTPN